MQSRSDYSGNGCGPDGDEASASAASPWRASWRAPWRVVAASVAGTSHRQRGTPCQDAHETSILPGGDLVVAVADGAGTAAEAQRGAALATATALQTVTQDLARYRPASRGAWQALIRHAFVAARAALEAEATEDDVPIRSYATTLLVAVLGEFGLACGLVGDCAAVIRRADGHFHSLCPLQRGDYVNTTNFLTQANALDVLDIQLWPEPTGQAAFFSDGLAALAMNLAENRPFAPFFTPCFAFVESAQEPAVAAEQLHSFLESERVCTRTSDDKTLVLVQRL